VESLDGKVAPVTGASSGIGRACARTLSHHGVRVALAGRDAGRLDAAATGLPSPTITLTGDVAAADFGETAVATTVRELGSLDIVLSNAGVYLPGEFAESDVLAMQQLLSINVFGAMALVRAALPALLEAGQGDLIMTSSVSGHQSIHWEPIYSASKHAVQAFTSGVRRQLVGTGVRIGAVAPGMVLNELWGFGENSDDGSGAASDEGQNAAAMLAEGKGIASEDVAEAVVFMLTRPRRVTIRDLVILPSAQKI